MVVSLLLSKIKVIRYFSYYASRQQTLTVMCLHVEHFSVFYFSRWWTLDSAVFGTSSMLLGELILYICRKRIDSRADEE